MPAPARCGCQRLRNTGTAIFPSARGEATPIARRAAITLKSTANAGAKCAGSTIIFGRKARSPGRFRPGRIASRCLPLPPIAESRDAANYPTHSTVRGVPDFRIPSTLVQQANRDFTITCQSKTRAETWIEGTQKLTTSGGVPLGYAVTPLCANTLKKKNAGVYF